MCLVNLFPEVVLLIAGTAERFKTSNRSKVRTRGVLGAKPRPWHVLCHLITPAQQCWKGVLT